MSLFLFGWVNAAVGQGAVFFQNSGPIFRYPADRLVYLGEVGGEKLVGTNYAAALYYTLPGLTDLIPVPDAIRLFRLPTTTLPGTWNTQPTAGIFLPGVPYYTLAPTTLQVRVWDIQQFETWEAAIVGGGLHGESLPFLYYMPLPTDAPRDFALNDLRAFAVIPEPSTFALSLLGLGGVGVWCFTRRRGGD